MFCTKGNCNVICNSVHYILQKSFDQLSTSIDAYIILKRAVGHTPKSKTLDEVYLHPKANQMIEAFDSANQLVKDEVLALPEE